MRYFSCSREIEIKTSLSYDYSYSWSNYSDFLIKEYSTFIQIRTTILTLIYRASKGRNRRTQRSSHCEPDFYWIIKEIISGNLGASQVVGNVRGNFQLALRLIRYWGKKNNWSVINWSVFVGVINWLVCVGVINWSVFVGVINWLACVGVINWLVCVGVINWLVCVGVINWSVCVGVINWLYV